MKLRPPRRPSPALAVALLALFVALGGPAEAARLINGKQIKRGTIRSKQIKDRSLTLRDLSRGARASLLATPARSVGTAQLKEGAIGPAQLAPGAVTAAALTAGSVSSATIIDKQVGNADLADSSVTAGKIGTSAVRKSELAGNAVGTSELANGAVTADKLVDSAVTGAKVADGSLGAADLADMSGTVNVSFGSVASTDCSGATVAPPGLAAGETLADDVLLVTPPVGWPDEVTLGVRATGDGNLRVTACNPTSASVATPSTAVRVLGIDT